jgi:hypothetical protein
MDMQEALLSDKASLNNTIRRLNKDVAKVRYCVALWNAVYYSYIYITSRVSLRSTGLRRWV